MDINVNVDAEAINKQITEAVAKSAIGKQIKRVIDEEVKKLSTSWQNPLSRVVGIEIEKMLRQLIQEEYMGKIKEWVSKQMSDEFVKNILGKMWKVYLV
ncbi:MAG TPA: hypothetical protein ENH85_14380 [Candidatus Scalindua sp.]|nr:hypothetical protein [Candidatus Scalindua sp.]